MASQASSPNQASLVNPPPSPALPAEGRESEGHAIRLLMTTNERRHPISLLEAVPDRGTFKTSRFFLESLVVPRGSHGTNDSFATLAPGQLKLLMTASCSGAKWIRFTSITWN